MARIARFQTSQGSIRYGLVEQDDTFRLIEGDVFGKWQATDETVAQDQVKLLAPVDPPNVIAIGLNYRKHAIESGAAIPQRPLIFIKATTAVTHPGDPIKLPLMAPNEVDYECELAIVIGKTAHNVSEENALDYVLGYTCANDVSQRKCQLEEDGQWARGKSFDTFAPLGPWIETDLDPENAPIRTRLNGETMQESNTNDLIYNCHHLISYCSQAMTLLPGTIIMTGTPSGVGMARDPKVWLKPGDLVEIEIDGIGRLTNPVIAES